MFTNLLSKTLKDDKNPDRRFIKILMIIVIPVLFYMLINAITNNGNDYKAENNDLKKQLNEKVTVDQKTIDSLKDEIFNVRLEGYIEKDKFSKQLDSINDKLQKIK